MVVGDLVIKKGKVGIPLMKCCKSLTNLSHNVVSGTPCHERDCNSQF